MAPGRPKAVSNEVLSELFCEFEDKIVQDNNVIPPSRLIWEDLAVKLNSKMSAKAIYTAAIRWWKKRFEHVECEKSNVDFSVETTLSLNSTNSSHSSKEKVTADDIGFTIALSPDVWKTIDPIPADYRRKVNKKHMKCTRRYWILKRGVWSNVLMDRIAMHRKRIICSWSFKTCKVYISGEYFITFIATCTSCNATLLGKVKEKPNDCDSIKFRLVVKNFDEEAHKTINKTVKNYGAIPKEVAKSSKTAMTLSRERANATGKMFEQPKGRQYTANAIRCRRYRDRIEQKLSSCPVTALEYLQHSFEYVDTIQHIARSPFFVMYRTPNQNLLYKEYKKRNRYTIITCDATGGVAHKLPRPGGKKSGQILLYVLVISDGFQVGINSMLAEPQHANIISFWLSEWIRLGGSIPNEFVTDISLALIGGAVRVFTSQRTIGEYIQYLFEMHDGSGENIKEGCFIRIDFAHLMKAVAKSKHLKNVPTKARDFFIRSVALLAKKTSLQEAKDQILAVFVVALSTTEGKNENDEDVPCETYKKKIVRQIMGIDSTVLRSIDSMITENEVELTEVPNQDDELIEHPPHQDEESTEHPNQNNEQTERLDPNDVENLDIGDSSFSRCIKNLRKDAERMISDFGPGDRDNLMFNQNFAKYFGKLCTLVLLWSGVNCKFFNALHETGTSATSESNFKNVKQSHKDLIPCSVDVFVKEDINLTKSAITDASRKYITIIGDNDMNTHTNDSTDPIVDCSDSSDKNSDTARPKTNTDCIACKNNDFPTGAHLCLICHKKVHILTGCSLPINDEEGYGEKRICTSCSKNLSSPPQPPPSSPVQILPSVQPLLLQSDEMSVEMNYKEAWNKKKTKKTKKSFYAEPCPNWDLNTNINKKAKIGLVRNGNITQCSYMVGKTKIALRNTCSFDAIAQILAGAYAYNESYRDVAENSEDEIFQLSILLAKNAHQKKINNLRAKILFTLFEKSSYDFVVTQMLSETLKKTPSYREIVQCSNETCQSGIESCRSYLSVSGDIFDNNLKNIEIGIASNLNLTLPCRTCQRPLHVTRMFGDHLFIEIPTPPVASNINNNEPIIFFKLSDVKLSISVEGKTYILFGLILFKPPLLEGGHYVAAIKQNFNYEVYDDLREKPYFLKKNEDVVIQLMFYISNEL